MKKIFLLFILVFNVFHCNLAIADDNSSPMITKIHAGNVSFAGASGYIYVNKNETVKLGVEFSDPDNDACTYSWKILESKDSVKLIEQGNFTQALESTKPNCIIYQVPDTDKQGKVTIGVEVVDNKGGYTTGIISVMINTRIRQTSTRTKTIYATQDVYVNSALPNQNFDYFNDTQYGICLKMTDDDINGFGTCHTYLYFDLGDIPSDAIIDTAVLKLSSLGAVNQTSGTLYGSIYKISESWSENTLTWNNQPDSSFIYVFQISGKYWTTFTIDITSLVYSWVNGYSMNNGLCLKTGSGGEYKTALSSEYPNASSVYLPQIEITYSGIPTYSSECFVIDFNSSTPISSVTMNLRGNASDTSTTDSRGWYKFSDLDNGTYEITPSKTGYTFLPSSETRTISGSDRVGVNFHAQTNDDDDDGNDGGGSSGNSSGGSSSGSGGGCFIATAVYGTPFAKEVKILCEFRDKYLLTNSTGEAFVALYYRTSPPIADFIKEKFVLKAIVRKCLKPVVSFSKYVIKENP